MPSFSSVPTIEISYAGVPLRIDTEALNEFIEISLPFEDWRLNTTYRKAEHLTAPFYWPEAPSVKPGQYYYPWGASRWSEARFIITQTEYDLLCATASTSTLVTSSSSSSGEDSSSSTSPLLSPHPFILRQGDQVVETDLYLLPPMPIGKIGGNPGVFLAVFVDERFYWQYRNGDVIEIDDSTTWQDLIDSLTGIDALDIDLSLGSDVEDVYGRPHRLTDLYSRYDNAALLLDAVLFNLGRRLIRNLDGTYTALRSSQSALIVADNRPVTRLAGGSFNDENLSSLFANNNINSLIPSSVCVIFPKVSGQYINAQKNHIPSPQTEGDVYTVEVTTTDLELPFTGIADTCKTIRTTAEAYYTDLNGDTIFNDLDVQALAFQLANDYYLDAIEGLDESYPGLLYWQPEGIHDIIWTWRGSDAGGVAPLDHDIKLTARSHQVMEGDDIREHARRLMIINQSRERLYTRVIRMPLNFGLENFLHHFVSVCELVDADFWAILLNGSEPYSWQKALPAQGGTWLLTDILGTENAYEVNHNDASAGDVVWLRNGACGEFLFSNSGNNRGSKCFQFVADVEIIDCELIVDKKFAKLTTDGNILITDDPMDCVLSCEAVGVVDCPFCVNGESPLSWSVDLDDLFPDCDDCVTPPPPVMLSPAEDWSCNANGLWSHPIGGTPPGPPPGPNINPLGYPVVPDDGTSTYRWVQNPGQLPTIYARCSPSGGGGGGGSGGGGAGFGGVHDLVLSGTCQWFIEEDGLTLEINIDSTGLTLTISNGVCTYVYFAPCPISCCDPIDVNFAAGGNCDHPDTLTLTPTCPPTSSSSAGSSSQESSSSSSEISSSSGSDGSLSPGSHSSSASISLSNSISPGSSSNSISNSISASNSLSQPGDSSSLSNSISPSDSISPGSSSNSISSSISWSDSVGSASTAGCCPDGRPAIWTGVISGFTMTFGCPMCTSLNSGVTLSASGDCIWSFFLGPWALDLSWDGGVFTLTIISACGSYVYGVNSPGCCGAIVLTKLSGSGCGTAPATISLTSSGGTCV